MKRRVLIIDDTVDMLIMACSYLLRDGYDAATSQNAEDALKLIEVYSPDLIVCDIKILRTTGYDFLQELRRKHPAASVPVVLMSSKAREIGQQRAFELGADGFLVKPFSFA